jgi:hypothetical protein
MLNWSVDLAVGEEGSWLSVMRLVVEWVSLVEGIDRRLLSS